MVARRQDASPICRTNRASTRCICGRRTATARSTKIALKPGFYRSPRFSPDSKKIALVDSFQRLWYVDLETKKQVEVAQDNYQMRSGDIAGAWSPDSKWLALLQSAAEPLQRDPSVLARGREIHAGHRRHERCRQSRVRQGRQVSVLHRQHQLRRKPGARYSRHGPHCDQLDLPHRSRQDAAVAVCARERRGEGGETKRQPTLPSRRRCEPRRRGNRPNAAKPKAGAVK